jgi:competence protein ComEC
LLNTWSFAALLILLVDYSQLYNAGFLLSFGVYATICLAVRLCMSENAWFGPDAYIPASLRTRWEMRVSHIELMVRGTVIVSLSAWLVSVPITMFFFHSANSLSFLTNIAIAPILPVVMFCGMLHLCAAGIPWIGIATEWAAQKSAVLLIGVVSWFGDVPFAYLPAEEPAPAHALMIQGTSYGSSFTMLGNHGLLIDCGNATTAEMKTAPTLFHAGYTPAVLLVTTPRAHSGGGAEILQQKWPELELIRAHELPPEGYAFETQAGRFTIFPPPGDMPRRNAADSAPLVLWESPGGRVLYIGDASFAAYAPHAGMPADIVILGKHPLQPVSVEDVSASRVILLPSYTADKNTGTPHGIPVAENQNLRLEISGS